MKVTEHLKNTDKPIFSFEIIPPLRGKNSNNIIRIVEQLQQFKPPFIDVTSHSSKIYYEKDKDGKEKRYITKKRPGTTGICGVIQNRFNIDTVAHILCSGFTREETEDVLIELNFLGIQNLLLLYGDEINYKKNIEKNRTVNFSTIDLIKQVKNLKDAKYIDEVINPEPIDFCIGVAAYPEKHFKAKTLKDDINYLKQKVDAGADYIVTQMFFDNNYFFDFVKLCRDAGITVPVIPGIKILNKQNQINTIPENFYVKIPETLKNQLTQNPENARETGINWSIKQCKELINNGVKSIHFYIMNDTSSVIQVINKLNLNNS